MSSINNCQSINDFINAFKGGTRLNRFLVEGSIAPGAGLNTNKITPFHIRAATIPEAAVGGLTINHRGRSVTYSGDRAYGPWNITILDDHDGSENGGTVNLHRMFHDWHERINSHGKNITTYPGNTPDPSSLWAKNWSVTHLDVNGNALGGRKFTLFNIWPVSVGAINLDMSQDNTLNSFAVTLAYSHYTYDGAPFTASDGN